MYLLLLLPGLIGLYIINHLLLRKSSSAPLPPGPWPLPIVGNMRDLPPRGSPDWLHWLKHKDLYGPISTVSVFGQRVVILNEAQLAIDLLDKKSAVHSDRPLMPMARLSGLADSLSLVEYGKRFQGYRKCMHREIGTRNSVSRFDRTQEVEVRRFLLQLLDKPEDLQAHTRRLAGAFVLKITYGYSVDYAALDPLVEFIERALEGFSIAVQPGTWLVDFAPILKHIPFWFPGAGFKRTAQQLWEKSQAVGFIPFAFVKEKMKQGHFERSYLSNLLQASNIAPGSEEESIIKWSATSLYAGGADTSVATIVTFFLSMVLYPDVQKRAQEEIDRAVGRSRLPGYADREKLPYINALVKEALRWHSAGPMGLPHCSMEDDICEGYLIPKGSVILANIWAFCHDSKEYKDPMAFRPERFLGESPERDPNSLVFGFGRRICPGRIVADSNVYLAVVQSLAAFHISRPVHGGREVDVQARFMPTVISHPEPFEMSIRLRDAAYGEMIRSVEREHPWDRRDAEMLRGMLNQ